MSKIYVKKRKYITNEEYKRIQTYNNNIKKNETHLLIMVTFDIIGLALICLLKIKSMVSDAQLGLICFGFVIIIGAYIGWMVSWEKRNCGCPFCGKLQPARRGSTSTSSIHKNRCYHCGEYFNYTEKHINDSMVINGNKEE